MLYRISDRLYKISYVAYKISNLLKRYLIYSIN